MRVYKSCLPSSKFLWGELEKKGWVTPSIYEIVILYSNVSLNPKSFIFLFFFILRIRLGHMVELNIGENVVCNCNTTSKTLAIWLSKRIGNNFPFLFLKCSHFLHTGGPLQKFKNAFRDERENVKRFLKHLFIYSSKWRHSFAVMSLPIKMSVPIKSAFWPREIFCIYVLRTGCIFSVFKAHSLFHFTFL